MGRHHNILNHPPIVIVFKNVNCHSVLGRPDDHLFLLLIFLSKRILPNKIRSQEPKACQQLVGCNDRRTVSIIPRQNSPMPSRGDRLTQHSAQTMPCGAETAGVGRQGEGHGQELRFHLRYCTPSTPTSAMRFGPDPLLSLNLLVFTYRKKIWAETNGLPIFPQASCEREEGP